MPDKYITNCPKGQVLRAADHGCMAAGLWCMCMPSFYSTFLFRFGLRRGHLLRQIRCCLQAVQFVLALKKWPYFNGLITIMRKPSTEAGRLGAMQFGKHKLRGLTSA
ncbi:hypothetical protein [Leisingera sp. S232]|uniref:hypothetical protein n=1 Tax=Leisingera sp. S232 TaxID=3415132 RepID=UPI003C79BBC9